MDVTPPRLIFACLFLGAMLGIAHYELRAWLREADARQAATIASCPNFDTLYVHDTHWDQAQRTTKVRKIPAPPCDPLEDTTR